MSLLRAAAGRLPHLPWAHGRHGPTGLAGLFPGVTAIVVKEVRGRMRGRRAFVALTVYLLILAGFLWMVERLIASTYQPCFGCGPSYNSSTAGLGMFIGMLMLQSLLVAVLGPSATAGSISGEREHQTLELLSVTPISSWAIPIGKLLSALAWVFLLVLASIPVTALVFVFGGVGPEDVIRGYVVLLAAVVGFGSVGLFFSALVRRTGAATALTYVTVLALVLGGSFLWVFSLATGPRDVNGVPKSPPEALLYLNPFVAELDVACGAQGGYGGWCSPIGYMTGTFENEVGPNAQPVPAGPQPIGGVGGGTLQVAGAPVGGAASGGPDAAALVAAPQRDLLWPKSVAAYLILALVMLAGSVRLVRPTRRLRARRGAAA